MVRNQEHQGEATNRAIDEGASRAATYEELRAARTFVRYPDKEVRPVVERLRDPHTRQKLVEHLAGVILREQFTEEELREQDPVRTACDSVGVGIEHYVAFTHLADGAPWTDYYMSPTDMAELLDEMDNPVRGVA